MPPADSPPQTVGPGTFTLSLDFELLWGTVDLFGPERFRRACEVEREIVIDRLLGLLEEYEIPATWCILGHLFLDRCSRVNGTPHPEIVRPTHGWVKGDWFRWDPCSSERAAPLFYGRELVERIRRCKVPQEIGLHSFSHVIYSDAGCPRTAAASDLAACRRAAEEIGVDPRSFAFPRNGVGHLDLLTEFGFSHYRGPAPRWYERREPPRAVDRLARLWTVLTAQTPPVVVAAPGHPGLINVPGSMIYFPSHGLRGAIPISRRVTRAVKGLEAAARAGGVFHLWFHPTNLADRTEEMVLGLRQILAHVRRLASAGQLSTQPMQNLGRPDAMSPLLRGATRAIVRRIV